MEWAYGQAGVSLPRTSQAQWAKLRNRSVPLGKVQAGDIVFSAGSDGTATSPGHEAMMISGRQIIEAPSTGQNIRIRAYNPSEWQHAARPTGAMTNVKAGSTGSASVSNGTGPATSASSLGNSGLGAGGTGSTGGTGGLGLAPGSYGSSEEVSNVQAALLGGGLTGGTGMTGGPSSGVLGLLGSASTGNGQGSSKGSSKSNVSMAGGGSASANWALAKKMAAAMRDGRAASGRRPAAAVDPESGFNATAQNPDVDAPTAWRSSSTAHGGRTARKPAIPGCRSSTAWSTSTSRYGTPARRRGARRSV